MRGKKPFKKHSKKPLKIPPPSDGKDTKVGGVKRSRAQDGEKVNKKQKVSCILYIKYIACRRAPSQLTTPTLLDRKERRVLRKSHRPLSELTSGTKGLWEKLRRHDLKGDDKVVVMEKLMTLLSGHMYKVRILTVFPWLHGPPQLSLKHDTARVVQSCLKNGSSTQRTIIFTELRG